MNLLIKTLRLLQRFYSNEKGSALPLIGLGFMTLVGSTGIAIDMGRVQIVQSRLSNALDAAGLAAGSVASTVNLQTQVNKYFYVNFPNGYMGTTIDHLTITPNADNSVLALHVDGSVSTTFMKIFGVSSVAVAANAQITRASKGMELILVIDTTGSMKQSAGGTVSKIDASKTAANTLLDALYGTSNDTIPNLYVGVVPFSQAVNISTSSFYSSWLDTTYNNNLDFGPRITGTSCAKYTPTNPDTNGAYDDNPLSCAYTLNGTATTGSFAQANWDGCVEARSNGSSTPQYDITDDPPSVRKFRMYNWPDDSTNNWRSTNANQTCTWSNGHQNCSTTSTTTTYNYSYSTTLGDNKGANSDCPQPMTPMVKEKSLIKDAINQMTAAGNTHIDLGLAWGWRMLSPRWQTLWGGQMNTNSLPLAYNSALMYKVVILMTDGDNTITSGLYSAYGYPTANQLGSNACTSGGNCATGISQLNTRTATVCQKMKDSGIIIYTVALGESVSSTGQTLLENCATKPEYYFLSPTTDDLQTAFKQIGDSLANLRISQ